MPNLQRQSKESIKPARLESRPPAAAWGWEDYRMHAASCQLLGRAYLSCYHRKQKGWDLPGAG